MKKTNAIRILDRHNVAYQIIELLSSEAYGSALETAEKNGLEAARIFKTLVTIGDQTGIIVALVSGDKQLDLKALAKITGNKKMTLLPLKELTPTTGYLRGGCSPLGMKKDYPVILDQAAEDFDQIYVNAGKRGFLMQLAASDLIRICQANVGNIAE